MRHVQDIRGKVREKIKISNKNYKEASNTHQ